MPEISRFYGIIIKMYFGDHNPPHFHVEYGDDGTLPHQYAGCDSRESATASYGHGGRMGINASGRVAGRLGKVEKSGTAGKDRSVAVIAARSTALNTTGAALNNRVSLGPSLVVFYAKDAWSAGLILQNAWSLVGAGGNRIDALVALVGALALGAISKK